MKVMVFQRPNGALPLTRSPLNPRLETSALFLFCSAIFRGLLRGKTFARVTLTSFVSSPSV